MNEEIWKDIEGYEGIYQISNYGRVKSLERWVKIGDNKRIIKSGIRTIKINNSGYNIISLFKDGKEKTCLIHRLVAEAFIPNPENLPEINHKDENKTNNRVDNLEWCTHEYNTKHGTRIERMGLKHRKPVVQLNANNEIIGIFDGAVSAGEKLNIDRRGISKCCRNPKLSLKGHRFKFLEDQFADWLEEMQDEDMEKEKVA